MAAHPRGVPGGGKSKDRKEQIERVEGKGREGGREGEGVAAVDISKVLLGFVVAAAAVGPENIAIVY